MEDSGMGEKWILKSFRQEQKAENGLGCDVGSFYCLLGVLRENQKGILEFGLELSGFKPYYIIFGVENQGAVGDENTQSYIMDRKCRGLIYFLLPLDINHTLCFIIYL